MTGRHLDLTPEAIRRLTTNTEPWMSCDDCFEEIDGYIESLLAGPSDISPRLRAHLIGCVACFEEAWSLLLLAADEKGADLRQALAGLRRDLDCAALSWPDPPVDGHHRDAP